METLEGRLVPANIVWTNKYDDGFERFNSLPAQSATVSNADLGCGVIEQAITSWEKVIKDFGNISVLVPGHGAVTRHLDRYELTCDVSDVTPLGELAHAAVTSVDLYGRPYKGAITVDEGMPFNWFFDATPGFHSEFAPSGLFSGTNGMAEPDFYSVALHEIGHALGFMSVLENGDTTLLMSHLQDTGLTDPGNNNQSIYRFIGPTVTATFSGNAHVFQGASGVSLPSHPDDVLAPNLPTGTRRLISDLDVRVLGDAYGWDVRLPSTMPNMNFAVSLDPATKVMTVAGAGADDIISLLRDGSFLVTRVNGAETRVPMSAVNQINVFAGEGADTVAVYFGGGSPLPAGGIAVEGGSGDDTLLAMGGPGGSTFTLNKVLHDGRAIVFTAGAERLVLKGMDGRDTFNIQAVLPGHRVDVVGGAGDDRFYVGNAQHTLDSIRGQVAIDGGTGENTLALRDYGRTAGREYNLGAGLLSYVNGPDIARVDFANLRYVELYGTSADDTFDLFAQPAVDLYLYGRGGIDRLYGADRLNIWRVTGVNGGTLNDTVTFHDVESLVGGGLQDALRFSGLAALTGGVNGGGGAEDFLNYAAYGTGVYVDLRVGTATAAGGFTNIESVIGSAYSDTLYGKNRDATWDVNAPHDGSVGYDFAPATGLYGESLAFYEFEYLQGGTGPTPSASAPGVRSRDRSAAAGGATR